MATAECLYTQTQCGGPSLPTPLSTNSVSEHATPARIIPGVLYFSGFGVLISNNSLCGCDVVLRLPELRTNPLPENTEEGHMVMICRFSRHGVYNIP